MTPELINMSPRWPDVPVPILLDVAYHGIVICIVATFFYLLVRRADGREYRKREAFIAGLLLYTLLTVILSLFVASLPITIPILLILGLVFSIKVVGGSVLWVRIAKGIVLFLIVGFLAMYNYTWMSVKHDVVDFLINGNPELRNSSERVP